MHYLIDRYSPDPNDLILDPFVGVGGTLLAATTAKRKAIGIDINDRWKTVYHEVCNRMSLSKQKFIIGNSTQVLDHHFDDDSVGMILTDVPYWAMDKLTKTRGRFSKAGEDSRDKLHTPLKQFNQATILSLNDWQKLLRGVFTLSFNKLLPGKPLIVFIGNMYRTLDEQYQNQTKKVGRFLLLSAVLADILLSIGYMFKEEIVWYAPDKALHIFGYPYSYIPSVVHQDILIFTKPR
jgi:tRNA G10  N-methylase Trm11